jgi:thiosulfate/3-mercaptopyruvate sulfurtransferase
MRKKIFFLLTGGILGLILPLFLPGPGAGAPPFKNFDLSRLVETAELAEATAHPQVRIIDMRTSFLEYLKGHIPNAVYLNFETLRVPRNGIPSQAHDRLCLEKLMADHLSVSNDMWVVLYSEKSNPNATFLAWTLDFLGHKKVGVLNGGWEKWTSEKYPVVQEFPSLLPKKFFAKINREALVEKKWVQDHLTSRNTVIVDTRPPRQYSGEEGEEIRKGHIPGARNLFWETTVEGDEIRVWKKKEDLERVVAEAGVVRGKEIVVHCRTGREASHVYFTLKHVLGYPQVRLYRGSWVEWSADKTLPIKAGLEP